MPVGAGASGRTIRRWARAGLYDRAAEQAGDHHSKRIAARCRGRESTRQGVEKVRPAVVDGPLREVHAMASILMVDEPMCSTTGEAGSKVAIA